MYIYFVYSVLFLIFTRKHFFKVTF